MSKLARARRWVAANPKLADESGVADLLEAYDRQRRELRETAADNREKNRLLAPLMNSGLCKARA